MNDEASSPDLLNEILLLEHRIEEADARHQETLKDLKAELDELKQLALQGPTEKPAAAPLQVEPETPASGQEKKATSSPPPMPNVGKLIAAIIQSPKPVPETPPAAAAPQAQPAIQPPPMPAPPVAAATFEQKLGQVWLVRIGIVLLLTGLVLGANWAYKNWIHNLPPGARLAGLYLCSLLIGGAGVWLSRKESYKRYGEVLVAGGLAFFYYCTFAAHQVARLRVIESPVTAAVLLLGAAGCIAAVSWFRNSRATAVMGIALASYATMVQPIGWLSAVSNLILATVGIGLMLRPGWGAPGIASMIGTYAAFGGWQILGAAGQGQGEDRAALWFLPASWAIFAIPGMFGRFRDSLGERGRAFFTAANNGLFFLTFSWVWLERYGSEGFWKVPAVFGCVLLVLGAIGRKREDRAAATNVIQGLAALSLAVVLKFDGFHLTLALALESLMLAIAFHRFRKRAEYSFSLLAGVGAAAMATGQFFLSREVPLWSDPLCVLLVAAAAVLFRIRVERAENPPPSSVRSAASLLAYSALAILVFGCFLRLSDVWKLPAFAGAAAVFVGVSFLLDRKRWMPELTWSAGILGAFALQALMQRISLTGGIIALIAGLVSCLAWHRPPIPERKGGGISADPAETPGLFAWLHSIFVPLAFCRLLALQSIGDTTRIAALAAGSVALIVIARFLKARRLEITAPFLNVGALLLVLDAILTNDTAVSKLLSFSPALAAGATLVLLLHRREEALTVQVMITRATLFVAWAAALMFAIPRGFIDLMALSAALAFAFAWRRKHLAFIDAWGWTAASLAIYLWVLAAGDGSRFHGYRFEGIALVALLAGIALWPPKLPQGLQRASDRLLPWLACTVFTIWSTHLTVDAFGWKAVSVLWTILGFALVSLGLVLGRVTSRKAGFILLGFALVKLFAVDVWDFGTFMRVVSFIALGLALLVLGLFYHRFAPAMKRLLDEEAPEPEREPAGDDQRL